MRDKLRMYSMQELASVMVELTASGVTGFTLDALETRLDEKYESRPTKRAADKGKPERNMWTDPNDGISSPPTFA